ncbi:hypothetical protein GUJ93_ZPchr0014g47115 [Zizania palustris]|uniref:Uncharacterized protein n=1 Tax=Zizania palustris TaxID=103762 RepID=A0A8J5W0B3_ZIZPA|nr:hypothetical protein GUJ93_ZPchr0014g47115 [Zizania palustris]
MHAPIKLPSNIGSTPPTAGGHHRDNIPQRVEVEAEQVLGDGAGESVEVSSGDGGEASPQRWRRSKVEEPTSAIGAECGALNKP